jgi:hypothetical protein
LERTEGWKQRFPRNKASRSTSLRKYEATYHRAVVTAVVTLATAARPYMMINLHTTHLNYRQLSHKISDVQKFGGRSPAMLITQLPPYDASV